MYYDPVSSRLKVVKLLVLPVYLITLIFSQIIIKKKGILLDSRSFYFIINIDFLYFWTPGLFIKSWLDFSMTWLECWKFFTFFFKINLVLRMPEQRGDICVKFDQFRLSFDTFVGKKIKSSQQKVKSMTWLSAKKKKSKSSHWL